ncbi:MAG: glycosyltransferase family 39 protein [Candidatus Zixiibacteriota bacterium]
MKLSLIFIILLAMKDRWENIFDRQIIAILIIAAVVRAIFLIEYYQSPFWNHLLVDSLFHHRWALALAGGDWLGQEAYFRAPFYIYILGIIYKILGESILLARIFGFMIGIVSVYLTYLISLKLFNRRTANIAAFIQSLYPIMIYFESELLVDNLFTMFVQLSILFFIFAMQMKNIKWYLLTGVAIGLAAITRPLILGLIPVFLIWTLIVERTDLRRLIMKSAILIIAMAAVIAPVAIRNLIVADDFIPISSSGGINFYIGNNDSANGISSTLPPPLGNSWEISDIKFIAEQESRQHLSASEISDFWYQKGFKWISQNHGDFIRLYLRKLYFCLSNLEVSNNRNLTQFFGEFSILGKNPLNYGLLISFAVVGLLVISRKREWDKGRLFIGLIIVSYFLLISLFFINARFRLPVIPLIIIIGAYGWDWIIEEVKLKAYINLIKYAIVPGLVIYIFASLNPYGINRYDTTSGNYNLGNYYLYRNQLDLASEYLHRAIEEDPTYLNANLNLGVVFLKMGLGDSAEYYLSRELLMHPGNAKAYTNQASLALLRKDYAKSSEYCQKALELKPYLEDPYILLLRIAGFTDDRQLFDSTLKRFNSIASDISAVYYEAALVMTMWNNADSAIALLEAAYHQPRRSIETDDKALYYAPASNKKSEIAYQLGYLYGLSGHLEKSKSMSETAIRLDSNMVEAYINLANVYMIKGDRIKAVEILELAENKFPRNETLKTILRNFK